MGLDIEKYAITVSANKNYPERLEETDYLETRKRLSQYDQQMLDRSYSFEPTYRQYYVSTMLSEEDKAELQRIFILADVLPQVSSPETLIIDITWTADTFYLH
jgi:hypothetical protein